MVIVFSVNAGKVINTQREVVEALLLMLFKTVLDLVCSPGGLVEFRYVTRAFFTFYRGVYFVLTGNTKASNLKGDQSFLSFVNECCKSYIFTVNVITLSRSNMESPSRTIKTCFFFKV